MFIHTSSKAPFAAVGETTPNESKEKWNENTMRIIIIF